MCSTILPPSGKQGGNRQLIKKGAPITYNFTGCACTAVLRGAAQCASTFWPLRRLLTWEQDGQTEGVRGFIIIKMLNCPAFQGG